MGVAGFAVDLEILPVVRPIPGSLDNALGGWVVDDDGGLVIHVGVDLGLDPQGARGDRKRTGIVEHPGHQIGSIAAEIEECTGAIELWVREPGEEFRAHADFAGPHVAVHGHHFANCAGRLLFAEETPEGGMAAIPGGFVVDDYRNPGLPGSAIDACGVFEADGQRLLHHHGNAAGGTGLDTGGVVERAAEQGNGVGASAVEHLVNRCE